MISEFHYQLVKRCLSIESRSENEKNMATQGTLFDVTFDELCKGATAGCRLFEWILDDECISRETIHGFARKDLNIDDPANIIGWAFRDSSLWLDRWLGEPCIETTLRKLHPSVKKSLAQCQLWASTYQGSGNPLDIEFIEFFGLWDPPTKKIAYRTRHGCQVFAQSEDPSSGTISNRPITRYPGSSTGVARMLSWLNNCQEHHNCKEATSLMPNRLIEVSGKDDHISLRLRQAEEVGNVPFAALSYCWGGEQPMKCLHSNIDSYRTLIPFDEQSQTIKDAAKICHGIRVCYLWVDALCIIQDSLDDQSAEIAKMPSIYGSATVTIVAARSSSASEGFLAERFPGHREGANVLYRCIDGELGSIMLVQIGDEFEPAEPIDERGWTLQERLLSTRIIEIGSRQTRWICPETRSSNISLEKFTDGWRRNVIYAKERKVESLSLENIRIAKSAIDIYGRPRLSQFQDYSRAIEHWEKICETFTERALTISSDRALAISGIAEVFAELSGDKYLAGLWKSCFHSELLWRAENTIRRPLTYQGPSWSWLSVNGPVAFGQTYKSSECVAEILSCEIEPARDTAPYGLLREGSGRLVIAASTHVGVRERVPIRSSGEFRDRVIILGRREHVVCYDMARIQCDVEEEEINDEEKSANCLLAAITRTNEGDKILCQGLVLRWSSPEKVSYSRVGQFSYSGNGRGHIFSHNGTGGPDADIAFDWFASKPTLLKIV